MRKILLSLLLFLSVSSWAICENTNAVGDQFIGSSRVYCSNCSNCSNFCGNNENCQLTSADCQSTFSSGSYVYVLTSSTLSSSCNSTETCNSCYAYDHSLGITCKYKKRCGTQCEADSAFCVDSGKFWEYTGAPTCGGYECLDSLACDTTMNCVEYPFNRCEKVESSGEVYCNQNGCSGLPYTRWFSEFRKECSNECGDTETSSYMGDTLISFDSSCEDSVQCSNETKCVDFPNSGTYLLYQVCIVGNEQVGESVSNKSYTSVVGGGNGSCASLGMKSSNVNSNNSGGGGSRPSFPNSFDNNSVDDNCLIYGVGCPENFVDTNNYNDSINRSPTNCICEPLDGMNHISTIICPDGSRTTFFGSCSDWERPYSSSFNNPPESSSSGSENPPTSSGGNVADTSNGYPDWPEYRKGQKTSNDLQGSMVQSLKTMASDIVNPIKELINSFTYSSGDGSFNVERNDSVMVLDTILDTAGVLNAIFGRIDSNNTILDTLSHSSFGGCPCITLFQGNQSNSISSGHLIFKEMKIDFGDIKGVNLCRVISAIVVAFASVVSFFIGFSIFKNISQ